MNSQSPTSRIAPYVIPVLLLLALLLTAILYGYSIPGYPVLDDQPNLDILDMLHEGGRAAWWQLVWGNHSGISPRAIPMLSFVFDALRAPKDLAAMRATNIALHLATGMVVFAWLKTLFSALNYRRMQATAFSAAVAALWLLAPIQISTVYYPVQRMAMWPVFFILLGLWHYTWLRFYVDASRSRAYIAHLLIIYLLWLPLAILSKENGALLPLFLVVLEFGLLRHLQLPFGRWLQRGHWLVLGVFIAAAAYVLIDGGMLRYGIGPNSFRNFTVTDRVATQMFILWDYARQILFPNIARMGLYHDDVTIHAIGEWQSIVMMCITAAAFVISLFSLFSKTKHVRLMGFGVAFFFVGHLLESTVFNLELYFEHRNYLPSAGLILAAVVGMSALISFLPNPRRWAVLVLGVYLAIITLSTTLELYNWRSQIRLIEKVWENHPGSVRTNFLMAELYSALEHPDLALEIMNTTPQRLKYPSVQEEKEKLVALKQIYFSLASGVSPDPKTYDLILPPWPGSAIMERGPTASSISNLPTDKLSLLDWPSFSRTSDELLTTPNVLKSRAFASFVLYSAYIAIHFKDLDRAQRYFKAVHDKMRIYLPWTALPLFRFAVDAKDIEAARGYIHDFEQDPHWSLLYAIQIENMHEDLRALEESLKEPVPTPQEKEDVS